MKTVRVGDLSTQVRGVTFAKQDASSEQLPGAVGVVRAGNIVNGELLTDDLVFVPAAKVAEKQLLRRHDVLIAASSGSLDVVGKAARVREDQAVAFGAFCKVLRPLSKVDPGYFAHYFQTIEYRRHVSSVAAGANINNLKNADLDDIEIPMPPIEEQRRIAAVLDAADALRAKRRQALATLDTLTQAIFIDMFGDPTRWAVEKLGDCVTTTSGGTPSRSRAEYFGGTIPWVKSGELAAGLVLKTQECITAEAVANSSAKVMAPGTVLLAMYGATVGEAAILGVEAATNQAVCCLSPNDRVLGSYLLGFLQASKGDLIGRAAGGAQPNISQTIVRDLDLPLPPVHVQAEYSRRVEIVETLRSKCSASGAQLDALFASLQQRAFRGEL